MRYLYILATALVTTSVTHALPTHDCNDLPIVDLGYVQQQAATYNSTGHYYAFSNIAFASPPLGDLRFAAPQPPKTVSGIQRGDATPKQCSQAWPTWLAKALTGNTTVPVSPYESEDCLYLDVFVPETIFKRRQWSDAPVLVWIYGGGFVIGSKNDYKASGIMQRATQNTHSDGVIFVTLNYRLGAFGFLAGSNFMAQGGTPNAGLLDQRLALDWVQEYIGRFGGDRHRVTVMGESGGAESIGHHITAGIPSNECNTPFQQAILQSPVESPDFPTDDTQNERFADFLSRLNVTTLAQARAIASSKIQRINRDISADSPVFPFSLAIDNSYVLSTNNQGFAAGRYNRNITVMTGYNQNDGALFTPNISSPGFSFSGYVKGTLPRASNASLDYITNVLYSAESFPNATSRLSTFVDEVQIKCNDYAFQRAYKNRGFAYDFAVPPAIHVQDVPYTFFDGDVPSSSNTFHPHIAIDMQTYFTNFAVHGDPNAGRSLPLMKRYGDEGNILTLASQGYETGPDPKKNARCEYWATYHG